MKTIIVASFDQYMNYDIICLFNMHIGLPVLIYLLMLLSLEKEKICTKGYQT